jgi:hypothetical protein
VTPERQRQENCLRFHRQDQRFLLQYQTVRRNRPNPNQNHNHHSNHNNRWSLQIKPSLEVDAAVDPLARELIARGWAMYYLPYTPVRWQEARRDFERTLELDSRASEARVGLASILSTKLADGWSPVLQEDMPWAEHLLLEAIDKGGVSNRAAAHFTLGVLR